MQECKNITPLDKNGNPHGYWEWYLRDGNLDHKGTYHHGIPHGHWEVYSNGDLWYEGNYHHGEQIGYWIWDNKTEYHARI